ncbi:MAG: beta-glucuronidase [Ruminococcus sp.]|nr:beta-glucuronidase [Ruminococcus sp.]
MINRINLSGVWKFREDEQLKGIDGEYYLSVPDESIFLPSTTSIEKKGNKNHEHRKDSLTDEYAYKGYAWYYRTVYLTDTENKKTELFLERTRLTRVWINGKYAGSYDSLCTPHIYDISDYAVTGENTICVMVDNLNYPTAGGHMTSPDTQSDWNGITGDISLIISEKNGIKSITPYPCAESKSVRLVFVLENIDNADVNIWGSSVDGKLIDTQTYHISAENPEITINIENASLWDEFSPVVYTLKAAVCGSNDIKTVRFGMRDIKTDGMNIKLNHKTIYLRGKHDGMLFPLTGAAPTSVEQWHKYLSTIKEWGFNHIRFHTCCPPDAAFKSADMIGMYLQPELPFWGTFAAPDDENYNAPEQEYLIKEGRRILKTFGSHPSFIMMSLGNELWGSPERLNEVLAEYHALDDRHLYTQGSNNFQFYPNIQPNDDFFSGVRLSRERLIRGSYAQCDAPLGFVQTEKPNTSHSFDKMIFPENSDKNGDNSEEIEIQYGTGVKKVRVNGNSGDFIPSKPIITHETGQYCSYPDYDEIKEYTGALKPYNLEIFRERLKNKNMLSYAEDFHIASGMLAFNCYKLETEAAMRSEYISGFQLLDLQDFSGQGTALVGMLNALMQEKSFVRENNIREKWRYFCSDMVILAEIDDFVVTVGQKLKIPVLVRNMCGKTLHDLKIAWSTDGEQEYIYIPRLGQGLSRVGEIEFTVPFSGLNDIDMRLMTRDGGLTDKPLAVNYYELWAYPEKNKTDTDGIFIENNVTRAKKLLSRGEKVLYIPDSLPESVKGFYCTDFWCYPMFRSISESMGREIPVGTLGLLIDNNHPALSRFECRSYSTPQWYNIISHADNAILDKTPENFRPIVQTVDNFERNHKLGILYETKYGRGKLMVCTSRLHEISDQPEVKAFFNSIIEYMRSDKFNPKYGFSFEDIGLE